MGNVPSIEYSNDSSDGHIVPCISVSGAVRSRDVDKPHASTVRVAESEKVQILVEVCIGESGGGVDRGTVANAMVGGNGEDVVTVAE